MSICVCIPNSIESATRELESTFDLPLEAFSKAKFVRAWCALSYLNPGLHPDDFNEPDGGWSDRFKPYAVEAWRREEAGELADEELYPSDATWAGLYDQMASHTQEETDRRMSIAAEFGCGL